MLQERLFLITQFVPKDSTLADIGTDHAHIPIYLVKKKICPKVIATDINQGPLLQAKKNIEKYELQDKIKTRLGLGLRPLKLNEVDVAIIAGMGGKTITEIIKDRRDISDSLDLLILQPMTQYAELRHELFKMGYKIIDEVIAREKSRFYEIIVAKKSTLAINYDMIDLSVGPVLRYKKTRNTLEYLKFRKRKLLKIINHIKNINTLESKKVLKQYIFELELLEEVLK